MGCSERFSGVPKDSGTARPYSPRNHRHSNDLFAACWSCKWSHNWLMVVTCQVQSSIVQNSIYNLFKLIIDPMQKGVSLFFSYTNMKKIELLHHMKEHPKISNFLQFES